MPLKAVVETIDAVPEAERSLYAEHEGKFVLQVEPVNGYALENVEGLKTTFSKEMTKRKELEKTLLKYKDIDPERAREALARLEELGNIDPTKEADKIISERLEAAKRQLVEKHNKDMEPLQGRIGHLTKTVESLLVDQNATAEIAEAKGSVPLLLPHVKANTRVREVDGRYVVEVVDKDGNARIGNSNGDLMTIKQLVQEMRQSEAFGRAFEGSGHTGSGMPPGSMPNGGIPSNIKRRSDFKTRAERVAWVQANGQAAYFSLPA